MGVARDEIDTAGTLTLDQYLDRPGEGTPEWRAWAERRARREQARRVFRQLRQQEERE